MINGYQTAKEESVVDQAYCFDYDMLKEQFDINLEVSTASIYADEETEEQGNEQPYVTQQELPY